MPETLFCSHAKDFFPKTQESCASLHYREKKDLHTSTPLIRGSGMREGGGLHHTGTSLKERKKTA